MEEDSEPEIEEWGGHSPRPMAHQGQDDAISTNLAHILGHETHDGQSSGTGGRGDGENGPRHAQPQEGHEESANYDVYAG